MKCDDIKSGQLNVPITIERVTRVSDGFGGATESWEDIAKTFASVRNLSGTERWEASRIQPGNLLTAIIRFRGDSQGAPYYSAADRVLIRGRYYGILSVVDIEMARKWIQLYLFEGKPS